MQNNDSHQLPVDFTYWQTVDITLAGIFLDDIITPLFYKWY